MAKIVLVCLRHPAPVESERLQFRLRRFLHSLCPDNLTPAPPIVSADAGGLLLGVFNPEKSATAREQSAYVGWLSDSTEQWWRPWTPAPVGSYAVFRSSADTVELLADFAASRTIWFACTPEIFVASTTQRAIPYFLGAFEPNASAQAWMLSCGTLGPTGGWDSRARRLGPAGSLRLDRQRWQLTLSEPDVRWNIDHAPDEVHARRLDDALETTLGGLRLDLSKWVLPLSGGFDSRAILLRMKHREGLRTVTWGTAAAVDRPDNDACVARQVAAAVGVENRYFETDLSAEPVDTLLERFLVAGDGRTDGFLAYADGFRTWRSFYDAGVRGVIRGDHGFGPGPARPFKNHGQVLYFNSMTRWSDHAGLPRFADFGMPQLDEQALPESYAPRAQESPADWRDRLYQLYRIPAYHAGQSDLKSAYVEICSPLFVRPILELTRCQPEHLRSGKAAFRDVMRPYDIPVPYASEASLVPQRALLANPRFREFVCDELSSQRLRATLTSRFADFLLSEWPGNPGAAAATRWSAGIRGRLKRWVPAALRSRSAGIERPHKRDLRWIALRACIISRMHERLTADASSHYVDCHRRELRDSIVAPKDDCDTVPQSSRAAI